MQVIYSVTDEIFSLCMWMLLDPAGHVFFWTASLLALFVLCLGAWVLREGE
jgi:hypothetical protein